MTSVSSVNGVGPKKPVAPESRAVKPVVGDTRMERRGLQIVPYRLCASHRPLADIAIRCVTESVLWAKRDGVAKV